MHILLPVQRLQMTLLELDFENEHHWTIQHTTVAKDIKNRFVMKQSALHHVVEFDSFRIKAHFALK